MDRGRLTVWRALSAIFLDTEITEAMFDDIAAAVVESGYSADEVRSILLHELYPALKANLRSVAGEWAGWSDGWLLAHIRVRPVQPSPRILSATAREIDRCWERIAARLPPEFI
jgi:hypothetical protein